MGHLGRAVGSGVNDPAHLDGSSQGDWACGMLAQHDTHIVWYMTDVLRPQSIRYMTDVLRLHATINMVQDGCVKASNIFILSYHNLKLAS
uniref:Uncharacterized protein n=1 Tax=Panagrellus redivivus TaxID=6233 RepID=A0A7E4VII6_PANRE